MSPNYSAWHKRRPREVQGGILPRSKTGPFGESLWAELWTSFLEEHKAQSVLVKARSYARHGQVLSLRYLRSSVQAVVQGSRKQPYELTLRLKPFSREEWHRVSEAIRTEEALVEQIRSGEMSEDIANWLEGLGLTLFPKDFNDLKAKCTCPDYVTPCKHALAVYYLLAEALDEDPFLVFKLRGMSREALMRRLEGKDEPVSEGVTPRPDSSEGSPPASQGGVPSPSCIRSSADGQPSTNSLTRSARS